MLQTALNLHRHSRPVEDLWHRPAAVSQPLTPADEEPTGALARYDAQLYALALRLTGAPADARDLVQDTCERALRGSASLRAGSNLPAWLATILHHLFLDRVRRQRREVRVGVEVLEQVPAPEPEAPPRWAQVSDDALTGAIAQLSPEFREVFVLHSRGLSYQEIAERLGIPRPTVGTRLNRARAKLRKLLEKSAGRSVR